MYELTYPNGEPVIFHRAPLRKFRGLRLPGSILYRAQRTGFTLYIQEFRTELYSICFHLLQFGKEAVFQVRDFNRDLRMEMLLTGELAVRRLDGEALLLRAGQYHVTDVPVYQSRFAAGSECSFITFHFSPALIENLHMTGRLTVCAPRILPPSLNELVFSVLQNPYAKELQRFFYDNSVRQGCFLHLASAPPIPPGELTDTEIAAIHSADNLIASNISVHLSIRSLAKHAGTNEFTLKQGFRKLFGVGPFERLMQRRMNQAATLLETTDKPIKEIAELAGYSTLAGFITGFRKRYGITPLAWRQKNKGI